MPLIRDTDGYTIVLIVILSVASIPAHAYRTSY